MAETSNAHTEAPSGGAKSFPPFESDTFASQLFWLGIAFVLLYVVMAKVALPRIAGIMAARRESVDRDLGAAAQLKADAEAALQAYEKTLAEARTRAQTLAGETRAKLNAEAEEARKELEAALHTKLAEAERTIADTKARAMSSVRGIASEAAGAIVGKLTGLAPAEHAVAEAVDAVLKR
ncbi:MAG: F0F1 ATP synthase subunit B' [Xanthobacteraceae bacterium]|jgi:F-type H+-transporting ATPase subunit b|nr:F0F1 ATP synthase subunit B' [Xanthobacteraceae bacterium]MBV9627481.1 F0F1 ATP synthase subunit B' [Xanthobacteraceae bacterium]